MASPVIAVKIVTDSTAAVKGTQDATQALKKFEDQADQASKKTRDISGGIASVGDTAGRATTGLRDMSDAVAMAGFPQLAAGMGVAATGLESLDGAANLYKASQEAITQGGKKLLDMMKQNTVATKVFTLGQKAAALATNLFGRAMNFLKVAILTNPIFWIVAILIAIAVAFVLLYKRCEGFRKVVDAVFKFVANIVKSVMNVVMAVIRKVIDWAKAYFQLISKAWSAVWNAVVGFVKGAVLKVTNTIQGIIDKVKWVVEKIKDVFAAVKDFITKPFKAALDWIKDHFKLPELPSWLPGVGKSTAVGLSLAGRGAPSVHASTGQTINITFTGPTDPHATVRELRRLFREDQARLGRPASRAVVV